MNELILQLKKFDSIVNPTGKKIYLWKDTTSKTSNPFKTPIFFTIDEIIKDMEIKNLNFAVDLSKTDYVFIDCDSEECYLKIQSEFKNLKYIEVKSLKPFHYHYYFKKTQLSKEHWTSAGCALHDYYKRFWISPYAPVLPNILNTREFTKIPEEVDFIPDNFFSW